MLVDARKMDVEDFCVLKDGERGAKSGLTPLEKLFATDNNKNLRLKLENGDEVEVVQGMTMAFGEERYCLLFINCMIDGTPLDIPISYKLTIENGELSLDYKYDENREKMLLYYCEKENKLSVNKVLDFDNFDNIALGNGIFVEQLYKKRFMGKVYCVVRALRPENYGLSKNTNLVVFYVGKNENGKDTLIMEEDDEMIDKIISFYIDRKRRD